MAGVVGYTVGSVIGWGIGYYGGRPLIESHGRWLHLGPENLDRAESGSSAGATGRSSSAA